MGYDESESRGEDNSTENYIFIAKLHLNLDEWKEEK